MAVVPTLTDEIDILVAATAAEEENRREGMIFNDNIQYTMIICVICYICGVLSYL